MTSITVLIVYLSIICSFDGFFLAFLETLGPLDPNLRSGLNPPFP